MNESLVCTQRDITGMWPQPASCSTSQQPCGQVAVLLTATEKAARVLRPAGTELCLRPSPIPHVSTVAGSSMGSREGNSPPHTQPLRGWGVDSHTVDTGHYLSSLKICLPPQLFNLLFYKCFPIYANRCTFYVAVFKKYRPLKTTQLAIEGCY